MTSLEVVTPVDPGSSPGGVQTSCKHLKELDSGFRRNDEKGYFSTFYEAISKYLRLNPFNPNQES